MSSQGKGVTPAKEAKGGELMSETRPTNDFGRAKDAIARLSKHYRTNFSSYHTPDYKEAQLRQEFIDKFFMELGWDLRNDRGGGVAPQYREVITEPSLETEGSKKAPDYVFRIGQTPRFFVEAKKPTVHIEEDHDSALQIRSYGWTAKLPLCILTNFSHLAVYDTKIRPYEKDKAATARIKLISSDQYPDAFQEIWDIFSREAAWAGSFDRFADAGGKRGTGLVDEAFLEEIDGWRESLARNIAIRNQRLGSEELNDVVQRIIDRVVFLRMAEDHGIEPDGQLLRLAKQTDIFEQMLRTWKVADAKYNSGLFDFSENGDRLTPELKLDDGVLSEILSSLYFPKSPYAFKVLPAEILGSVYERFLGKVIRLTADHHAKIDEKPDVKKAGGVYYTPSYIVDHIVESTVGCQVAGKNPKQLKSYRVLDLACGSGSFLLGVYKKLLAHYLDWYTHNEPEKKLRAVWKYGGDWRLTIAEKKKILTEHIFGVDIDRQAVEVTKLSLLLRVLEDEDSQTIGQQLSLFPDRVLPDIDQNIKCGNSLIEPAYYAGQILVDKDEMARVNPFDWKREFEGIMREGGFDCIVGNPPYINIDDTWGRQDARLRAIKELYPEIYNDKTDILFYFLAKAVSLCAKKGQVGFIVSRAFLAAYKADKLRKHLLETSAIQEIIDFRNHYVFQGVGITTAIIRLSPGAKPEKVDARRLIADSLPSKNLERLLRDGKVFEDVPVTQSNLTAAPWAFVSKGQGDINGKIDAAGEPLGKVLTLGQGMQTGCNEVFGERSRDEIVKWKLDAGHYFRRATNTDVQRYAILDRREYLLFLEAFEKFDDLPKGVQKFLKDNADLLKARAAYKRGDCEWWKYTWPLHKDDYGKKKRILCPYLATSNRFAIDSDDKFIGLTDTTVIFENGQPEDLKYFLALLNSKLLTYRFRSIGKLKSNGILEYFWNSVTKLPIKRIDMQNSDERKLHDEIVNLTQQMIAASSDGARAQAEVELKGRRLAALDEKIDSAVYRLYGITDREIGLVEEGLRS
ncbi:MAG TPA: N-6 DNA methylase [Elusimicrobiota bacterium]|nr:N-6 DNA methylase [Elusimicrobiota bacterium]